MNLKCSFTAFIFVFATFGFSASGHAQDAFAVAATTIQLDSTINLAGVSTVLSDDAAAAMVFDDEGFVGYGVVVFSADGDFQMMIDSTESSSLMLEALLFDDNGNSTGSMMIVVVQEPDSATESKKIGEGHAYDKHVLGTNNRNGKEFEKDKDINGKNFQEIQLRQSNSLLISSKKSWTTRP